MWAMASAGTEVGMAVVSVTPARSNVAAIVSVSTNPGSTLTTAMLWRRPSWAMTLAIRFSAALLAP